MLKKHWTFLILGAWLIVSPWVLGFTAINTAVASSVVAGVIIVLVSLWAMFSEKHH